MTIAITGASGQLGRIAAELLLEQVDPSSVVLITRDPAKLAEFAGAGVQVRAGDFHDADSLATAFAGVTRLLLISTADVGTRLPAQIAAVEAAKAAGVQHIAYTSVPRPTADNPALVVADHLGTERAIQDSGLTYTFLRNNMYSEFQVPTGTAAVASGKLFTNAGDGATAYVTRDDCAAAAAAVLATDGHENVAYDVTGPEAITPRRLAELLTEVTGKPIDVVPVDDAAFTAGLIAGGVPAAVAPLLASFGTAARDGFLGEVTTTVADLTGRQPPPLGDVLVAARGQLVAA